MDPIKAMFDAHKSRATFVLVYIHEAHAVDVWPINSSKSNRGLGPVNIQTPHDSEERCRSAVEFARNFTIPFPVLVDPLPDDPFRTTYAAWPTRCYVIHRGKMAVITRPNDACFDVVPVQQWLDDYAGGAFD